MVIHRYGAIIHKNIRGSEGICANYVTAASGLLTRIFSSPRDYRVSWWSTMMCRIRSMKAWL